MRDVSVGPLSRNAMQRFQSRHPYVHISLLHLWLIHLSHDTANVRNMLMPVRASHSSLCLYFIFLVFFYFSVQHLMVSHTICLLSLSLCLLQCAIEIFAFKNTDELLFTLRWLLWCALEVAGAF